MIWKRMTTGMVGCVVLLLGAPGAALAEATEEPGPAGQWTFTVLQEWGPESADAAAAVDGILDGWGALAPLLEEAALLLQEAVDAGGPERDAQVAALVEWLLSRTPLQCGLFGVTGDEWDLGALVPQVNPDGRVVRLGALGVEVDGSDRHPTLRPATYYVFLALDPSSCRS